MSSSGAPAGARAPGSVEFGLLAGLSLAWGTSYMFTKVAVDVVPPFSLILARAVIGVLAMLLVIAVKREPVRIGLRDVGLFAVVGLVSIAAPLVLIASAVSYVNSAVAATTMSFVPLLTTLFAAFRGERPTPRNLVGIAVGLIGIVVLFGPESVLALGDSAKGLAAGLCASIIFAGSLFATAWVRHHGPIVVTAGSLLSSVIWTAPLALMVDGMPDAMPSLPVTFSVLMLGLWNTAAASLLMFALVPRAGPAFTALNNYLVPAVAVICGAVFLGESLTVQSVSGVLIVLAGVAISSTRRKDVVPPVAPVA